MNYKSKILRFHIFTIITGITLLLSILTIYSPVVFSQNETSTIDPPVSVKTDNEALGITVNWNKDLTDGNEIPFSIDFKHPFDETTLQHVNYDLHLFDNSGNSVYSKEGLHTHTGSDVQNIMIESLGSYTMLITVLGTGIDPPFDATRSGIAQIQLDL